MDESVEQTKKVMRKVAQNEGLRHDDRRGPEHYQPWQDFQRWLAAGECRVLVPYAVLLTDLIDNPKAVRWRRDTGQLIRAIQAHALLHRQHRRCTQDGIIIATIEDDYAVVRELLADVLATVSEQKIRKAVKRVIDLLEDHGGMTVMQVAERLRVDRSTASRNLHKAVQLGLIFNSEDRKGRPGRYDVSETRHLDDMDILPTVSELRRQYDTARERQEHRRQSQNISGANRGELHTHRVRR